MPAPEPTALSDTLHTDSFLELLENLKISLMVTTYQAGSLVVLRADAGGLNAHIRNFNRPMGLALNGHRLAIGTAWEIVEFHNVPAVAQQLPPKGKHDACYLPRRTHVTGDIMVHEMAWLNQELWFVNTRFSCLCTLDPNHSFVPRWAPPFITLIAPEDRCHLNGFCFTPSGGCLITALGATDTPKGWRPTMRNGGILMDASTGTIVTQGLSMPHSPRVHAGKTWILESGMGTLGTIDPNTGRYEAVCHLPGFPRGMAVFGNYAFVGVSQIRETSVFSDVAISRSTSPLECGIWVVDLLSGQIAGFLKFGPPIQETFGIEIFPDQRYPDIINDDQNVISGSFVFPTK